MYKIILLLLLYIFYLEANATTYYVAKNGNDNNVGNQIMPWLSIQKAGATLQAGDTVYIKAGVYNERVEVINTGMLNSPIVFVNYANDEVILDGTGITWGSWGGLLDISSKNYIEINGLQIKNATSGGFWAEDASYIVIKNCKTYNTFSSGIGIWNCSNVTIFNNTIELACNGGEQECITVSNSSYVNVYKNEVYNNGGGAGGGEGIDVKQGSHDVNIYQNNVHDLNNRVGIYADAWDAHTYNIEIYANKIYRCTETAIAVASEHGGLIEYVKVYNNLCFKNKYDGIQLGGWTTPSYQGATPVKHIIIINNTCVKNGSINNGFGFGITVDNLYAEDITIRNNILSHNSAQMEIKSIATIPTIDHNLIDGFNGTQYARFGVDSIVGTPSFLDVNNDNYQISATSLAVDNGNSSLAPLVDFSGGPRPYGASVDIGAYENNPSTNTLNLHKKAVKIYPNPTSEYIYIELEKYINYFVVEIYSLDGKKIMEWKNQTKISLSYLKSGIYLVKVKTKKEELLSEKVIITSKKK